MALDEPGFIVAPGELDERDEKFLDGVEGSDPQQIFLQRPHEPLGDAIALWFADEGRRGFDAEAFDLSLEEKYEE